MSPPQLDLLLSESYELLHRVYRGVSENETKIAQTFDGLHRTLGLAGDTLERNQEKVDHIVSNAEILSTNAVETLKAARERYVDGPQVTRIMNNVERSAEVAGRDLAPLLARRPRRARRREEDHARARGRPAAHAPRVHHA